MQDKKVALGQFFTKASLWLKPQVKEYISQCGCFTAYDPFAGGGDLLSVAQDILNFKNTKGLDIDTELNWDINDSLLNIPTIENAIIITNPPYIAKQSASRKKIDLSKYFSTSPYDDVYLIALDKMLKAQKYVVAIIPESFINSNYKQKSRLNSITILEENPFEDTENPVCVACFDEKDKEFNKIKIYKNECYKGTLQDIQNNRIDPSNSVKISFNDKKGWLGIRAVDSTNDKVRINFDYKENINYDWEHKIKVSSRHFTLVDVDVPQSERQEFISHCNKELEELREKSSDILLTPFKGNTKSGIRRRRLDFRLARAIMEKAYKNTSTTQTLSKFNKEKHE